MYQTSRFQHRDPRRQSYGEGSSFDRRPSSGPRSGSRSFGSRPMGSRFSRPGAPSGRFSSRRPNRFASHIPPSKYIKKAVEEVVPEGIEVVLTQFQDMPLHEGIKQNIIARKFTSPTKIQELTIPHILERKDVVGIANTGTGKTGAFVIPLLQRIYRNETRKVLIIVPTRELAQQIQGEIRDFSFGLRIFSAVCIGGGAMYYQKRQLQRNPHFVVGTPGRLKDFVEQRVLCLSDFDTVVLDEVDRMVDMGFIQDITHLLSLLPHNRQSLFFSATVPPEVEKTILKFSKEPITISVSTQKSSDNVDQDIIKVPYGTNKFDILHDLLLKDELKKVLIFSRTKHGAEKLADMLYDKDFKVSCIHGDKPQRKREEAIRLFQDNVATIMIATDVAARGLDIDDITHVINYDEPATYEDYIHRIGRTGRANKKGVALTFVQ